MGLFLDVFKDSAVDCVKMLPFLFLAFYLLEVVEQHASDRMTVMLGRSGGLGPLIGSLLGSVPQCGFSIMASDFCERSHLNGYAPCSLSVHIR